MEPKISVIVPIYGIERYVGLCIESIINQTYKNLEIILVDDGGKDRCPEICDLYKKKDQRIRVIHKRNGGLVSARKAGLQESNGEYISYVDGDDWIGPGYIESLYSAISITGAEMVCAGQSRDLFAKSAQFINPISVGMYEGEKLKNLKREMISYNEFYRPGITTYVWNKLFKREILFEPQMKVDPRITIGEDGAVTYPSIMKCNKIVVTDNTAYHYRQREDSMLKHRARFIDEAKKLKILYEYMMEWSNKNEGCDLASQVIDYVLSIAIIRSGGKLPQDTYSTFNNVYFGKDVVVYSAGTFGQQLINRFNETKLCNVVAWIDDDFWEYRRCCLDVDAVESITKVAYDYILVATVDCYIGDRIVKQLLDYGVSVEKILLVSVPETSEERQSLLKKFLDISALQDIEERRRKQGVLSHA